MRKSSWKVLQRTGGVKLEQGAAGGRCMPLSSITRRKGDPCQPPDGMGRCDSARHENASLCERRRDRGKRKRVVREDGWDDATREVKGAVSETKTQAPSPR